MVPAGPGTDAARERFRDSPNDLRFPELTGVDMDKPFTVDPLLKTPLEHRVLLFANRGCPWLLGAMATPISIILVFPLVAVVEWWSPSLSSRSAWCCVLSALLLRRLRLAAAMNSRSWRAELGMWSGRAWTVGISLMRGISWMYFLYLKIRRRFLKSSEFKTIFATIPAEAWPASQKQFDLCLRVSGKHWAFLCSGQGFQGTMFFHWVGVCVPRSSG